MRRRPLSPQFEMLSYEGTKATGQAIGYAKFRSRSHDAIYLINPNAAHVWPVTQSSPAKPPATPSTPVHRFVLIHLSSFGGLLRKVPLSAKVFIGLILSRSTHIDHVPRRVRDNVVGLPLFLDHGYLASFKLLELMLLRGGLGGNHLKA